VAFSKPVQKPGKVAYFATPQFDAAASDQVRAMVRVNKPTQEKLARLKHLASKAQAALGKSQIK
jgi:hypothetical protein